MNLLAQLVALIVTLSVNAFYEAHTQGCNISDYISKHNRCGFGVNELLCDYFSLFFPAINKLLVRSSALQGSVYEYHATTCSQYICLGIYSEKSFNNLTRNPNATQLANAIGFLTRALDCAGRSIIFPSSCRAGHYWACG